PWHHARPAFDDSERQPDSEPQPEPVGQPDSEPQPEPAGQPDPERDREPTARPEPPGPATDDASHDDGDDAEVTPRDTPDPEPPTGGSQ
ncbi:NADH-quinone oxidoreductase subunit C, partial [Streptomyces scabiei]|nr:NADH-quinone oxidoreductase subunit C [Streptomyces scabiei]